MMPRNSEDEYNGEPETEAVEKEGAEVPGPALAGERKKAEEYLASWQRAQADFVNYKRRMEQERLDFNRYANANLILGLLPVLDDLERALEAVPAKYKNHDWVEGVRLVERKFKTSLEGQGVKPIQALGEPFDPNFHEALRQDKGREGIIIEVFQKGYMLNDKLLRPARVVVGNGEGETKEEE
ncbi:MAG TPA: nucleotide exchange factor GrpE [Dehalococcoidales bacterium]|nr:MAG: nucleotide exchange factor GrpE [Chloroflexi bacterium RBG_16_60_22]HJX12767.1 nucleotide exchange factor GrpE [Dehalococcoidales bacterium]